MRLYYTTTGEVRNVTFVPNGWTVRVDEKDGKTLLSIGPIGWFEVSESKAEILRQLGWPQKQEEQKAEPVTLSPVEWHFEPQGTGAVHRVLMVGGREMARLVPTESVGAFPGARYTIKGFARTYTAADAVKTLQSLLEAIEIPPIPEYKIGRAHV